MEKEILEILKSIQEGQSDIVKRLDRVEQKLDGVVQQTADLTEFRTETNGKLDSIAKDAGFIKHKLNRTEEDVFNIQSHLKIIK
jgi:uncharacterized protein YoxC